jgi:hypothetical protein
MNEEQVRQIIREELVSFMLMDKYTFQKHIQIFDGRNIQVGRTTGTNIGTATDQKLGFYGVIPIIQGLAVGDPAGQVNDLDSEARTAIATIIDRLQAIGIIA